MPKEAQELKRGWLESNAAYEARKAAVEKAEKEAAEKAAWIHKTTGVSFTEEKRKVVHATRAEKAVKLAADPSYVKAQQEAKKAEQVLQVQQKAEQDVVQKEQDRQASVRLHMTDARYAEIKKQRELSALKAPEADKLARQKYETEVDAKHVELRSTKKAPIAFNVQHSRAVVVPRNPNLASGSQCTEVLAVREKMEHARSNAPINGKMSLFKFKKPSSEKPVDVTEAVLASSVEMRK